MDKEIFFNHCSKERNLISGRLTEFDKVAIFELPEEEIKRFENTNKLIFNELYDVYDFGESNPAYNKVLKLNKCKFKRNDGYGDTYIAESWEWINF